MTDYTQTLVSLRRPRLLIRAARLGMASYNRKRDLKRITHSDTQFDGARALRRLMALEADVEQSRRAGDMAYSPARHVDLLIALMSEAQLWLRARTTA